MYLTFNLTTALHVEMTETGRYVEDDVDPIMSSEDNLSDQVFDVDAGFGETL